ncbi:MAG: hypothetical protein IPK04_09955 [Bdellovibrionales bacterium]|nr:hypothetical protein [Bdellovibrionales bacterium]
MKKVAIATQLVSSGWLKVGFGLPIGGVLRSRISTGEIWSNDPTNPLSSSDEDLVLTRFTLA